MKVYLDCSPLTNAQVSGIGVYNKNLFLELKNELQGDVFPVLKWSRLKNKNVVETHLHHPVTALPPVLLNKKIVYHGTDHKLNTIALGPKVVTIHDMQPFIGKWLDPKFAQGRIDVMTKVLNSDVQRIIAVSHFTKNEIIKYFPHTQDRIDVVHHGHNFKNPVELKAGEPNVIETIAEGRPFLFFVGNIEERKNLINQMKAFEILKETHKDLQFILAGREGYNFQKIAEYAHNSKYKNDIHITGYLSEGEKNYALKHTSCLMFASFYEGFGIPVIEALSSNSNILISRSSSLDEVGQGYCYQCNPESIEEIAATTETIMQKGNLKKVDLESWKREWSWNKCARETIAVYKKSYM